MELNLVPLIEAAKGITWQGAVVILACLAAACYLARLRLLHGDRERAFWMTATPEQIQARAATTATLLKPSAAPPSPVVPLVMLAVFLGCTFLPSQPGPSPSILQAHKSKPPASSDWLPAAAAGELARVGTGDPGQTPAPGKLPPPGKLHKDCDSTWCRPPSRCTRGECVNSARKAPPTKLAGQVHGPSSIAVRASWQDTEPEAFVERQSDELWLAGVIR